MSVTRERIEQAYEAMIEIVSSRSDGEKFMPVIFRLEQEMVEKENISTALERIKAMSSRS